jgi:prepilin-type N-terminal cleavage/methylation domain-containing protein
MKQSTVLLGMQRGFTLIEVLLSLGLFSMVALIVYSTFSAGLLLNRRSHHQNDVYRQARWSLELIKRDLENMVFYDFANSYEEGKLAFEGKEDQIQLILPTEEGLKVVRYYLTSRENDRIHKEIVRQATSKNVTVFTGESGEEEMLFLVREEMDFAGFLADEHQSGELEIIGSTLKRNGLRFFYYDHETEASPGWVDQWENTYFPLIVHVELEFLFVEKDFNTFTIEGKVFIPTNNYKLI